MRNSDLFRGNNKALISSINALLELDAKGSLAPHGIGEMARDLLETCAARLPAEQHQGEPVCWVNDQQLLLCSKSPRVDEPENPMTHNLPRNIAGSALQGEYCNTPLFRNTDTAEVVALRGAYLRAGEREHELRTELAKLRAALKFYADRDHYSTDDGLNWDSCSGEPANILWHESEPWFIEDGSIARAALAISAQRGLPDCATCNGEGAVGNILDTVPCPDCAAAPPAEPDDLTDLATWKRRAIEAESKLRTYDPQVVELGEQAMQALLADPKPSELVLTKCRLCDQLQADLTERDQQIDALRQGMKGDYDLDAWLAFVEEAPQLRLDAGRYRWLRSRDLETISQGGVFAGLTPDNLVLNEETLDQAIDAAMAKPKCRHCGDTGQIMAGRSGQAEDGNAPIIEPCEDCDRGMPDLASRPEERGTPETEPCSGCGTPGWTGNCDKCVPY